MGTPSLWLQDAGCNHVVPITPTPFAIPENPGLYVQFHADGHGIEKMTVEAGGVVGVYTPRE
jgi:hypothetical protein